MKKMHVVLISLLLFSWSSYSDNFELLKGQGGFKVDVDVACYAGDSVQSYVEMYYGFRENALTYVHDSSGYNGCIVFLWEVKNDSASVARKRWSVPHTIDEPERLQKSQTLMGIETIGLPAGTYHSILHWFDKNDSTRADSVSVAFTVREYPAEKEYFSDIELCTSIQNSDNKQSMFYKNTLEVIPNPGRLYGSGLPILYYYATVYNLRTSGLSGNVIIRTDVLNAAGTVIITKDKVKPRVYNSSVEIGTINLSAVKTGTYEFRISLLDTINTLLATTSKRFFVYKIGSTPDSAVTVIGAEMSASKYAVLSMDEVDRLFSQARYIASATEKEQYQALTDLKVKQKFLYDFWRRRDANMATPFNEIEEQYYQRIERANTEFTSGFKKGWESDRGRVLVLYGNPDEVEHLENTSESNPYEIWHYHNLQGGVIFVFVDRDGMGNPQLVHSTHRDELRDDDWYNRNALKMK